MLKVIRGLLQVLLEFRSYRRIRPKAFVRPDHLEDPTIADFADSSKVLNQKVELRWPRNELYGLLWQYLGNEPSNGKLFREGCSKIVNVSWVCYSDVWMVPKNLKSKKKGKERFFMLLQDLGWAGTVVVASHTPGCRTISEMPEDR